MRPVHGFADLNIPVICSPNCSLKDVVRNAFRLGYQTIAINTHIDEGVLTSSKKNKKKEDSETRVIPAPPELKLEEKDYASLHAEGKKPQILQRLTVTISDAAQTHKLSQSENVKKYDILAVLPTNAVAFSHACSTLDIDLITFSYESRSSMRFSRKMYNLAVLRGIYFEIMYAPAIQDSTFRKSIIHAAHVYHAIGKSRNIIITSGATRPIDLRGPYDIANLGLLFGLTEGEAKNAISTTCRSLMMHAEGRKTGKCVTSVAKRSNLPASEQWKVEGMESESDEGESDEESASTSCTTHPPFKKLKGEQHS